MGVPIATHCYFSIFTNENLTCRKGYVVMGEIILNLNLTRTVITAKVALTPPVNVKRLVRHFQGAISYLVSVG